MDGIIEQQNNTIKSLEEEGQKARDAIEKQRTKTAQAEQPLGRAGDDPAARDALRRFFDTQRFVPLDAQTEQGLSRLRTNLDLVRKRLE